MKSKLTWNPPKISTKKALYNWTVDYAATVHNGSFGKDNIRIFPRPWVYRTVARNDVVSLFENNILKSNNFDAAFRDTVDELEKLFTESIETADWQYNSRTYRRNGSVIEPGKRDIVDLGNLRDSLNVTFE